MNETNNSNENMVNQAPVEPVVQAAPVEATPVANTVEQPVPQSEAPTNPAPVVEAAPVASEVMPVTETSSEVPASTEEKKEETPSDDNSGSSGETEGKLRFPFVVILILTIFIVFLFVYYFILITPEKLFAKALKMQMGGMIDAFVSSEESEYDSVRYKMKTVVETVGDNVQPKEYVTFLDGLEYNFDLGHDIKNGNYALRFVSDVENFDNADRVQHHSNIDTMFYYFNRSIYFKPSDAVLKTDTSGDSAENTAEIFGLIKEAMYEAIDLIDVNKVSRTIASKKVKDQSLLAIKFNTEFTNDEINKILQTTIDNLLDNSKHPDFVKSFAKNLDITEEQAMDTLIGFKEYVISANNIKLNYYLNLACNSLVSYELTIDDSVISMSYLSGYYFIEVVNGDAFELNINLNSKTRDFDFNVLLDNEATYAYVEGDSKNVLDVEYVPVGNDLQIKFYEEKTKGSSERNEKPYLIINNHIDYIYNDKIEFFNEDSVLPIEQGSPEDLEEISYVVEKIGYEITYLLGLNLVNRTNVTAAEFAKDLFNIDTLPGEDEIGGEEFIETPSVDNVVGEEPVVDNGNSNDNNKIEEVTLEDNSTVEGEEAIEEPSVPNDANGEDL